MAEQAWWKLAVEILLPLLALFIFVLWMTGGFSGVKNAAEQAQNFLPDVSVGLDQSPSQTVTLPLEIQQQVDTFKTKLTTMSAISKTNCFEQFSGFSNALGDEEKTISINLVYEPSSEMTVVNVIKEKNAFATQFKIKMKPCVVAGVSDGRNVAKNFVNHFVEGQPLYESYYTKVDSIYIYYENSPFHDGGNALRVPAFGDNYVNDEGDNFNSNGFLFKGKNGEICLFPTNKHVDTDDDGIDEKYFQDIEVDSLPTLLQLPISQRPTSELQWCSEQSTSTTTNNIIHSEPTPPAEITLTLNAENYLFLFDRQTNEWKYQTTSMTEWKTANSMSTENLSGGVGLSQEIVEIGRVLTQKTEQSGYDYFNSLSPTYTITGVPP